MFPYPDEIKIEINNRKMCKIWIFSLPHGLSKKIEDILESILKLVKIKTQHIKAVEWN